MTEYIAVGPIMSETEDVFDGQGPTVDYRPWLEVEATTAREAKTKAAKSREFEAVVNAGWEGHPFKYIRVIKASRQPRPHDCPEPEDEDCSIDCPVCAEWERPIDTAIEKLDALVERAGVPA